MLPVLHTNSAFGPFPFGPPSVMPTAGGAPCSTASSAMTAGSRRKRGPRSRWRCGRTTTISTSKPTCRAWPRAAVDVTFHGGRLFIRGERRPEAGREYLYDGRSYGRFERVIALPGGIDTDHVRAELKDGVLRLALPKSPEAKPKKIAVQAS